ncbi:MAG: glycosyltransferase family 2 protein [Candidatus Sumerlaeaceae bacterium]|nr:glycosyltransferase family 2 protein [Candidatus Sumerlaeaceae bacterium]
MTQKIVLALPAYNESANLEPLIIAAEQVFATNNYPFDIVVVNDGSSDNTLDVLKHLAESRPHLHIENHPQNRGLGAAIKTSIVAALALAPADDDIIVNMDADNTHDPKYIPSMADKIWKGGYDCVIASRYQAGSEEVGVPFFRLMLSRGARLLFQLFLRLPEVRDYTCGYRAYRASLLREAVSLHGDGLITRQGFACTDELLVRLSTISRKITEVPFVLRYDKKQGRSKLPLMKTVAETLKMLILKK